MDRFQEEENRKLILERLEKRRTGQPQFPSAGCIFKNPKTKPAGLLIQECGLKGEKIGDAEISEKHANFIVNRGQARAQDVLDLITLIKKEVKKKFKIDLQKEVLYVGFDKNKRKA